MSEVPDRVVSYTANTDFWVQIIREDLDPYRIGLTNAAVLAAAGEVEGLTVLDGGCAEGYMARELARRGAKAVGVDSCGPLIDAALEVASRERLGIDFETAELARIPADDHTFDLAVLNHVVQDLEDPEPVFSELARVIKPGGRLIIMMLHPCFYRSARAEQEALQGHPLPSEYFSVRSVRQAFLVSGITSPAPVTIWLRPLEAWTSLLFNSGFAITGLTEPHPSAEQMTADPWWADHFKRPVFLLIAAQKL